MIFKYFRGDDVVVIERFSLGHEKMFSLLVLGKYDKSK